VPKLIKWNAGINQSRHRAANKTSALHSFANLREPRHARCKFQCAKPASHLYGVARTLPYLECVT
jgi:hypothetical protein